MKKITQELLDQLHEYHSGINIKPIKWNDIFDTEEELIRALFNRKIYTDENGISTYHKWCKGYEYITGFRRYYRKHGKLTDKQMTQLKRLACEIAYNIYCVK